MKNETIKTTGIFEKLYITYCSLSCLIIAFLMAFFFLDFMVVQINKFSEMSPVFFDLGLEPNLLWVFNPPPPFSKGLRITLVLCIFCLPGILRWLFDIKNIQSFSKPFRIFSSLALSIWCVGELTILIFLGSDFLTNPEGLNFLDSKTPSGRVELYSELNISKFEAEFSDGRKFHFQDTSGKNTVLFFWAIESDNSMGSLSEIQKIAFQAHAVPNLMFLVINVGESPEDSKKVMENFPKLSAPNVRNLHVNWDNPMLSKFQVKKLPANVILLKNKIWFPFRLRSRTILNLLRRLPYDEAFEEIGPLG